MILGGEHAVVYGYPAVVAAVNRTLNLKVEWEQIDKKFFRDLLEKFELLGAAIVLEEIKKQVKVKVKSQIPIGCGMGSSAALAVAVSTVVLFLAGERLSKKKINEFAYKLEKQAHGNPSGVDNRTVIFGGANLTEINDLLIVNTGKPSESTKEMVTRVSRIKGKEKIMAEIGEATKLIKTNFVEAIKRNERALERLGVVSKKTQKMIREIEDRGGVAKISGAGGAKTNSGIVLVYPSNKQLLAYLKQTGLEFFPIKVHRGLKYRISLLP